MKQVNIHEAKTHLSRLIRDVEEGEEVVIARANKPVVELTAVEVAAGPTRKFGQYHGQVKIHSDFDELPEDMMPAFEGEDDGILRNLAIKCDTLP